MRKLIYEYLNKSYVSYKYSKSLLKVLFTAVAHTNRRFDAHARDAPFALQIYDLYSDEQVVQIVDLFGKDVRLCSIEALNLLTNRRFVLVTHALSAWEKSA